MYRFIAWLNCLKVRFKSKRFIIPVIFALTFLFFPNNVLGAEIDSNKIQIGTQELFWDGTNSQGGYETGRFSSTQNHIYQWGTSSATYKLFRFAPLVNFTSLGVDTSYKARVAFYIYVDQPYSYEDKYCSLWSANGEKFSCSLYKEMDDQIGSSSSLLTFVYDFEWTSSTGYVEFWLNFDNFYGVPDKTQFMYTIMDFQGNVSGNQIILDGLGQTNEKLDKINDTLINSFQNCKISPNLVSRFENGTGTAQGNGVLFTDNALLPNTTYTLSGKGTPGYNYYINESISTTFKSFTISSDGSFKMTFTTKSDISLSNSSQSNGTLWRLLKNNANNQIANFSNIQLEKGSTATKYYPFGKEICTNKIDETNDRLDALNETLNDDNVSGATNTGNDFFDNFTLDDNGGISSIITLPLRVIRGLISGENNCSALNFEILGTSVYFPGGCLMWDNVSTANEILFQTIICGFFGYILLTQLFKDIEDLKNPNKEEVKTIDL